MPDDYYSDSMESSSEEEDEDQEAKDDSTQTALLPKSFFQGKNLSVGKQCKVEIVRLLEDEAEVKYVPHSEGKEKKPTMAKSSTESESEEEDDYA